MPRRAAAPAALWAALLAGPAEAALVAHWRAGEAPGEIAGAVLVSEGGGHDADLTGGAGWTADGLAPVPGGTTAALDFDGSGSRAVVAGYKGIGGSAARSLAFWVRGQAPQPNNHATIISWGVNSTGQRWDVRIAPNPAAHLRVEVGGSGTEGTAAVLDGGWHHVAVVFDDDGSPTIGDVQLFVDGVLDPNSSEGSTAVDTAAVADLRIGDTATLSGRAFTGQLDDIRLYDHALTPEEVIELFESGLVASFTATPAIVELGGPATLRWEVDPAVDDLQISPGVGDVTGLTVAGQGSVTVRPAVTTRYTLTAEAGAGGEVDARSLTVTVTGPPEVRLNEIMAVNERAVDDEDGDDSDWIELVNLGGSPVDLDGWYLSDDPENLAGWRFPAVTLGAGETLLVFASGKDRRDPARELHTDFQLSGDGEFLGLVRPDGETLADAFDPAFPPLPVDVAYGRPAGGGGQHVYFAQPTPGRPNSAGAAALGPTVRNLTENPPRPDREGGAGGGVDTALVITAEVSPALAAVASVTLHHRVGFGPEQSTPMSDDGAGEDATAGDGVYTAALPLAGLEAGGMVRWRASAADAGGAVSRFPPFPDPVGSPEYHGTVALSGADASALPVLHWFVANPGAAESTGGTRAAVLFRGEFYDNVFVRRRGGSTGGLAKKSFKVDFNKGHRFRFEPGAGRVSEINLNTTYTDKSYIRQSLAFEVYRRAGAPACLSFPLRLEQNGAFFSVAALVEQPDEDLLERAGLDPDGALYKMFNTATGAGGAEKKSRRHEGSADLSAFLNGINGSSGPARETFIFDHVDVAAMCNHLAATTLTQNGDNMAKNYLLYRDSEGSGEWAYLPWDLDLTFGRHFMTDDSILGDTLWVTADRVLGGRNRNVPISPSHPMVGRQDLPANRSWNRLTDALLRSPKFTELYLRRLRTVMDELLQPPGTPAGERWFENRLAELGAELEADTALDRDKWGQYGQRQSLAEAIDLLVGGYLEPRREHLYVTHLEANAAAYPEPEAFSARIPGRQTAPDNLRFGAIDFSPDGGDQDQEYIELVNPNRFAVDLSGWTVSGGVEHTFAPGTVVPAAGGLLDPPGRGSIFLTPSAAAFRARESGPSGGQGRVVSGGYRGHLSNFGETLVLADPEGLVRAETSYAGDPSAAQLFLVVSEVHYHPGPDPAEAAAEFIEILNTSDDTIVELTGLRFTAGIRYGFGAGPNSTIPPGGRILLVRDRGAFELRYGAGLPVIGEFDDGGRLDNDGERIKLEDADGGTVAEFRFNDAAPWPTSPDGGGPSLVFAAAWRRGGPAPGDRPDPDDPANWRPSTGPGGSPGGDDATRFDPAADPRGDPDGNGLVALIDYALGTGVNGAASAPADLLAAGVEELEPGGAGGGPASFLTLTFQRRLSADDVRFRVEASPDLSSWAGGEGEVAFVRQVDNGDGTSRETWRAARPTGPAGAGFLRLRVIWLGE